MELAWKLFQPVHLSCVRHADIVKAQGSTLSIRVLNARVKDNR